MKAAALTAVSRSRRKENASEKSEIYHLSVVGISFRGLVTGEPQQDHPRMEEKKGASGNEVSPPFYTLTMSSSRAEIAIDSWRL